MNTAIFPGSFYPFTLGHKDILDQALEIFDKVYICFGKNSAKANLSGEFLVFCQEQKNKLEEIYGDKISIYNYDCLLSDICEKLDCWTIIRGIRNPNDFVYEKDLARINNHLNNKIKTIFFIPSKPELDIISSSYVREYCKYNKTVPHETF